MSLDLVVTVPKRLWRAWLAEGALPGEEVPPGVFYYQRIAGRPQYAGTVPQDSRVYVVAFGRLRGYAPLLRVDRQPPAGAGDATIERWRREHRDRVHYYLVRAGGAVAVTIPEPIRGFQGWRYRWWQRAAEVPFPDWQTQAVTP
jgi:hypothetical protein